MKPINELNVETLSNIPVSTIRTNKKVVYLNIESGFDIETTSVKLADESKSAFMYIWMFGLGYGNPVYYGRTWEELIDLCKMLQEAYELNNEKRLIVYVHNLGFEFQFMRKYFEWNEVFAVDVRKPIKALCQYGIEFRDSYILSGYSLANTAKNLNKYKVRKLVGDLDYKLVRTPDTKLTSNELAYCENDIIIILAYIKEQIEQYGDISKIPLTNTGRVRTYVRNNCYYTNTNHRKTNKGKYYRYRKIMDDLTLNSDEYRQLKRAFQGGFTHANAMYSGKTLQNVTSIDFTSSYPAVMLAEQYPMSRGKIIKVNTVKQLEKYCQTYCLVFDVLFKNIRPKFLYENYISESKCRILKGAEINNGRVHHAELLGTTITNVDYDIIKQVYEWDEIEFTNVRRYHKSYLPKPIIESILTLYEDKTVLKGVKGKEVEYLLSKGMLNSIYGMCVTDIVKDTHNYVTDWTVEPADLNEQIDKYNRSKNRFLFYPWGVWVTAYARRNLWTGILAMGKDYVYSDTDSIKLLNYDKHKPYIQWYDSQLINKLYRMCDYYGIDKKRLNPKTQKGISKMIGVWDYEGTYNRFKTLGAKRYMVEESGNIELTVSGLSKQNGVQYMLEQCDGDIDKVFNMFNDDLYIPANRTGKMTHTYIDDYMSFMIQDYQGNETFIETESGVHLEECEFTLSIAKQYGTFLRNFLQGYIFRGVAYQ